MSLDLLPPEDLSDAAAWLEVWIGEAGLSAADQLAIVSRVAPEHLSELLRYSPWQ